MKSPVPLAAETPTALLGSPVDVEGEGHRGALLEVGARRGQLLGRGPSLAGASPPRAAEGQTRSQLPGSGTRGARSPEARMATRR